MTTLPEHIGIYRLTGTLGKGGMGVVYDAIDTRLKRRVALKTVRQDVIDDDVVRERFWREARLAASVNHPHVCQIYEIGEADGRLFIAMERLEGEPLSSLLSRGPVLLSDTVRVGIEILGALEALHTLGVVHRDLKPSNDMLEGRGNPEAFCSAVETTFQFPPDLDAWFYSVLGLSRFGATGGAELAVKTLAFLVGRGFVPYHTFLRHAWLEPLRHRTDFIGILEEAKKRHREGQTAFLQAGGEALLGTGAAGPRV